MVTAARLHSWHLLGDGGLTLRVDEAALPSARRWIPRLIGEGEPSAGDEAGGGGVIDLRASGARVTGDPAAAPLLQLGPVDAFVRPDERVVELRAREAGAGGTIDLAEGRARLQVPGGAAPTLAQEMEAFTLLTISAALLLSQQQRALLHAAAVVDPEGGAWLLVGDAWAGKTTTTINLVRSGYRFISDDHVVLSGDPQRGIVTVEGWPRIFHVDEGWSRGEVTGRRVDVDPATLDAGRWVRSAPLRGIYFPRISAEEPTAREPLSGATALSRLIRQTPWFVADPAAAPAVLALLRQACLLPAFALRVGLDSYRDPARLRAAV